jgi:hypothetical protein
MEIHLSDVQKSGPIDTAIQRDNAAENRIVSRHFDGPPLLTPAGGALSFSSLLV